MLNMNENRLMVNSPIPFFFLQQLQDMKLKLDLKVTVTYKNGKVKVTMDDKSINRSWTKTTALVTRVGKLHSMPILPLPTPVQS